MWMLGITPVYMLCVSVHHMHIRKRVNVFDCAPHGHQSVRTCICLCPPVHTFIHTSIHPHFHTYNYLCIHTCVHTCIHT